LRYLVVVDSCSLVQPLSFLASAKDEIIFFLHSARAGAGSGLPPGFNRGKILDFPKINKYLPGSDTRIVVQMCDPKHGNTVVGKLRKLSPTAPILVVDTSAVPPDDAPQPPYLAEGNIGVVHIGALFKPRAEDKWRNMELRGKIAMMKEIIDPRKPLWILTQNDPDPDALGSALALREVLRLNTKSAPIVTLKEVSRNENISMIGLLGIEVGKVKAADLRRAPQVAMVDVQPHYFPFRLENVKIVIDHHPVLGKYGAPFVDIRPGYGATSTILTEYLEAERIKISPLLATALYYAIKTDTLLLGRDVSREDFRAFTAIWPVANHQTVSQMERPRLKSHEVDVFIRALKAHTTERGCIFARLGHVLKEDLVPRLADFVMQIGDPEFALVWASLGKDITFAARSLNPAIDAGEVMRRAFGHIGSAGGHKAMARATMPAIALRRDFRATSGVMLAGLIKRRILRIVAAQKKSGKKRKTG
jgi:nanoRNase/pAp phosphatase (c-di-AMP/oligoRNAs hydrolase)